MNLHEDEFSHWHGDMEAQYVYTAGISGERFFRELRDNGKMMGTHCSECGVTYLPPRMYCEKCFSELDEWKEVPLEGKVIAHTIVHVDIDEKRLDKPYVIGFIRINGTQGGLVHYINAKKAAVRNGMRVKVVLRDQRVGSILDIEHFEPIE
ncbi:MAG: Zn-ribbon domain-containing OB-fold protein [Thermoplasmata archaeon]